MINTLLCCLVAAGCILLIILKIRSSRRKEVEIFYNSYTDEGYTAYDNGTFEINGKSVKEKEYNQRIIESFRLMMKKSEEENSQNVEK